MQLHFWAPTTSLSPSGFDPQLDVVSTPEPPQPWLHQARLNPGFRVVKNGPTLFFLILIFLILKVFIKE